MLSSAGPKFVSDLVGDLAWPIIVFSLFLIFRAPIERVLDRIKGVKTDWFELQMQEAVENTPSSGVPAVESRGTLEAEETPAPSERLTRLSRPAPGAKPLDIINRRWQVVEGQVDALVREHSGDPRGWTTRNKLAFLLRRNVIGEQEFNAIDSLYHARAAAILYAESSPVTQEKANQFAALATANNHILSSKMTNTAEPSPSRGGDFEGRD